MSFLSFGRLLTPTKVWKLFINKLQIKLHKLNRSKAIKKLPGIQSHKSTTKKLDRPSNSLSIQPKKFKHNLRPHTLVHLQKPTPPVYIDQLFKPQPAVSRFKKHSHFPPSIIAAPNNEDQKSNNAADEMWESMVFTSPHAQGINQRADEFIARFRSQLRHQEMLARRRRL